MGEQHKTTIYCRLCSLNTTYCFFKLIKSAKNRVTILKQATFGARFRYARKEIKGASQKELAREVGISPTNVSSWESKVTADVNADRLAAAARYLGVNLEWLLSGEGPIESPSDSPINLTPVASQFIPMITWNEVETFVNSTSPGKEFSGNPTVEVPAASPRQFALVLPEQHTGNSIMKSGDIVTCDPDGRPKHGKYLIYEGKKGLSIFEFVEFTGRKDRIIEVSGESVMDFEPSKFVATIESRLFL